MLTEVDLNTLLTYKEEEAFVCCMTLDVDPWIRRLWLLLLRASLVGD